VQPVCPRVCNHLSICDTQCRWSSAPHTSPTFPGCNGCV
jgi:hypothetical protein